MKWVLLTLTNTEDKIWVAGIHLRSMRWRGHYTELDSGLYDDVICVLESPTAILDKMKVEHD